MQIFLHIGAEKTGTSSVQQFFSRNRERLKAESILYSAVAGAEAHMALAAAAEADEKFDDLRIHYGLDSVPKIREFRDWLLVSLQAELQEGDYSRLVLSSEHCSSRLISVVEVERLATLLRRISANITIVLYIRRQDDFLCSTYSTDVKSGFTGAMVLPNEQLRAARYDYYEMLRRWASVFGKENVVCRVYEQKLLRQGDAVDDIAEIIGLPVDESYVRPPRVNESLDITALEFLRLFNETVPRFKDNKKNRARSNIVQTLKKVSEGPGPALSPARLAEFMRYFHYSNKKVAQEYFGEVRDAGDPLFGEAQYGKGKSEMQPLSVEVAVRIAAKLWEQKEEQIGRIAERTAKLQRRIAELDATANCPDGELAGPRQSKSVVGKRRAEDNRMGRRMAPAGGAGDT